MPVVSTTEFLERVFDYIVVGGGTSGLALAVRLSEDPNVSVGVIEAGGYDPQVAQINIPGFNGLLIANPTFDWTFFSTPQAHANNRKILQPRGKALGGSSMLNYQCVFRPAKEEYDALEELGNKGWNWNELLECHKKSENALPSKLSPEDAKKYAITPIPNPAFHGTEGPIVKSFPPGSTEIHAHILDGLETLGVPRNPETSGGSIIGGFTTYATIDSRTSTRSYAASGYYEPNKERPNLLVLTSAYVTKLLLQSGPGGLQKCVGVEFNKDEATHKTQAPRREVILSAGSFKTPHLLELSGIGNKKILGKFGIDCKINLPGIGENLQDHVMVPTIVEVDDSHDTLDDLAIPEVFGKHAELYKEGKGNLAHLLAPVFAFVPARGFASDSEIASWKVTAAEQFKKDLAAQAEIDETKGTQRGLEKMLKIQENWFADLKHPQIEVLHAAVHYPLPSPKPSPGKRYSTILCGVSHPFSRGTVHLVSSDPLVQPDVNTNYFANAADLDVLTKGIEFVLKLWETEKNGHGLKQTVKKFILPESVPHGPGNEQTRTDVIKEHIREFAMPTFHPVGTAAMLPREDGGVVDSDLRVYGTSNLRVVDLSIIPIETSCHTQSVAYAIAEKAAKIIQKTL